MTRAMIKEKILPIHHADKGWIIRVYKDRALYIVQCSEGNLTYEEIEVVNDIIFDPSFTIKLQKFLDDIESNEQTKKDTGIKTGVYLTMKGIKKLEIAESLVNLLENEVELKRNYIARHL